MRQLGLRLVPAEPSLDNDKQVDGILSESENLGIAVLMHTPQGSRDRDLEKGRQEPAAVSGFDKMLDADGHEERSLMTLTMIGQGGFLRGLRYPERGAEIWYFGNKRDVRVQKGSTSPGRGSTSLTVSTPVELEVVCA